MTPSVLLIQLDLSTPWTNSVATISKVSKTKQTPLEEMKVMLDQIAAISSSLSFMNLSSMKHSYTKYTELNRRMYVVKVITGIKRLMYMATEMTTPEPIIVTIEFYVSNFSKRVFK